MNLSRRMVCVGATTWLLLSATGCASNSPRATDSPSPEILAVAEDEGLQIEQVFRGSGTGLSGYFDLRGGIYLSTIVVRDACTAVAVVGLLDGDDEVVRRGDVASLWQGTGPGTRSEVLYNVPTGRYVLEVETEPARCRWELAFMRP
jgi:hypothetical protein